MGVVRVLQVASGRGGSGMTGLESGLGAEGRG